MDREASGTTVHKDRPHSMHAHPSPIAAGGERLFQFLGNLTLETKFKSSIYQLKGFFFLFLSVNLRIDLLVGISHPRVRLPFKVLRAAVYR